MVSNLESAAPVFGDRLCSPQIFTTLETRRYSVTQFWRATFFELLARLTPFEHNNLETFSIIALRLSLLALSFDVLRT